MANACCAAGNSQWFTDFKFEVHGREAVRVAARRDLLAKAGTLQTLDLQTLEIWLDGTFYKKVTGQKSAGGGAVTVTAQRQQARIGRIFQKEMVTIETENMAVKVFSSKANKYRDEALQLRNFHLDMSLTNVDLEEAAGVLPEIWGIRPMSGQVKAMLSKPKLLRGVSK